MQLKKFSHLYILSQEDTKEYASPKEKKSKVFVSQLCPTLCDPMDCSLPASSAHAILQARILEWVGVLSPEDLPDPGIEPRSPTLLAFSLPSEPPGKSRLHENKKIKRI